jgi:type I restriction enzyme S subunit
MSEVDFLTRFTATSLWPTAPAKHLFQCRKETNIGMKEGHRLALTMRGVIDRSLDDNEGLQSSDYTSYQIFNENDLAFKLIDLQNIKTSRVGLVPRRGIMSPAYIRLVRRSKDTKSSFYYWYFYAAYLNNIFNGLGGGIRQNLNQEDLLQIPVPMISHQDQDTIASYLDRETRRIDELIIEKSGFITLLREKRVAEISRAVTNGIHPDAHMKPSGVEWIGDIPASWNLTKLGYLGRSANGINIGGDAFGTGSPFISYGDVYKNRQLPQNVKGLVESSKQDKRTYSVRTGDVLFTRTSETIEEIAFPSVCMEEIPDAVFAGFLIRFRPYPGVLVPGFSKYAFQNQAVRHYFSREMKLVTRASLSQGLLQSLPVPLPPINVQQKIAAYLDQKEARFTELVSETERSITLLKEKRLALITAAVTGKIDVRSAA